MELALDCASIVKEREAMPQRTKYHDQSPQGGYRQFLNIDITGETVGELGAIWRSKFHSDSDRSLIVA